MELPKRKPIRLKEYDYSQNGYYFITICTKDKRKFLSDVVGDGVYDIPKIKLLKYGEIANKYIQKMDLKYDNIGVDKYVIMPNHIHLIIKISKPLIKTCEFFGTSQAPYPTNATIPKYISLFKRYCNREIGTNIFQRSFYDHIIRGEKDYIEICKYIENNPAKWLEDKFYSE